MSTETSETFTGLKCAVCRQATTSNIQVVTVAGITNHFLKQHNSPQSYEIGIEINKNLFFSLFACLTYIGITEINTSAIDCGSLQSYHEELCIKRGKELHFSFSFL